MMEPTSGMMALGGIPHRIDVHEGMVLFTERSGVGNTSIEVTKCTQPHGLLYVACRDRTGRVPAAHISKAVKVAEHFLGPNHYSSLESMHRFERRNALKNAFTTKTYGCGLRIRWRLWILYRAGWHTFKLWFPERPPFIKRTPPPSPTTDSSGGNEG